MMNEPVQTPLIDHLRRLANMMCDPTWRLRLDNSDHAQGTAIYDSATSTEAGRLLRAALASVGEQGKAVRLQFPTFLRKMWSGGEVQEWLDEQVLHLNQKQYDEGYAHGVAFAHATPPAPVSEPRVEAAARDLLTSLDPDNDLTNPEQVNAYCALEAALVSEPTAAPEGWRDISELPRDTDNTYLVCVENVGGTGLGPGWVDKGYIDPNDSIGWVDTNDQPLERGPWKVTKFMPWPGLPAAPKRGGR